MKTYHGLRITDNGRIDSAVVTVEEDGEARILEPERSLSLVRHSPDGFEWGYLGSGPSQLALALMLDATDNERFARQFYMLFKFDHVSQWGPAWSITEQEIFHWLIQEMNQRTAAGVVARVAEGGVSC